MYRARDTRLGRDVALKILPKSFSSDEDRLRRFEQEAKAAGLLNHPNITAVFDVGTHEGSPYIVSELLEGETLRNRLAAGPLSSRRATEFALQAARGLAAAHEKGIVHRDLKPENIFITKDGRLKILDFGLAKLIRPEPSTSAATEPGVVLGTFGYMSPEQVRGRSADARSDVFSFGAILYEMLTGQRAFHGDSAASTMSAILMKEPSELSSTNRKIHPGLERIVHHCLEKNPEARFHSSHDLAFDLEALTGVSAPATTAGFYAPKRDWKKPLAGAALVLAGLGAGFLLHNLLPRREPPSYERMSFRLGGAFSARFAPDGRTVVYSASQNGTPYRVWSRTPGGESVDLGLPNGDLLAVSPLGEMAIAIGRREAGKGAGTLARVPLAGGAPRAVVEDARLADWSSDGASLAVVRSVQGKSRIEYPVGRTLYETPGEIRHMRLSRSGDCGFVEQDDNGLYNVNVVGASAKKASLSKGWEYVGGLAWWPDDSEIWFAGKRPAGKVALYAVTPSGRERLVRQEAGGLFLNDIFSDGRVLLSDYSFSRGIAVAAPGETLERDLSWRDLPWVDLISVDGKAVVFEERAEGLHKGGIYIRKVDGSAPAHLGEGGAVAISPDSLWVLSQPSETGGQERFLLLPTGQGLARPLEHRGLASVPWGSFVADGSRILFLAVKGNGALRLYAQDVAGGEPRAVSPEGLAPGPVPASPNGQLAAAVGSDSTVLLCRTDGGPPRPLPGSVAGEVPIVWSADGRSLYVYKRNELPARIFRVDVETGRREHWKDVAPADRTGLDRIDAIVMTPDARAYAYGYTRTLGGLQIARGLQ